MSSGRPGRPGTAISQATNSLHSTSISNTARITKPDYNVVSNDFLLFEIMLELILRLPLTSLAHDELFTLYFEYHQHNDAFVYEAQRIYIEKGPIPLFTRDSFFYAKLNEALRCHDYQALISFRHLIISLHCELRRHQLIVESKVTVYRGQVISQQELDSLSTGDRSFIYWPNFASTSRKREVALHFAKSGEMRWGYCRVLFLIDICPFIKMPTSKPFASINHLTTFKQEEEILLMAGTVFRLCGNEPIWDDDDHLWIVHLELRDDYPQQCELYRLLEHHLQKLPPITGYLSASRVLRDMGRIDDAKKYLQNLLPRLPVDDLVSQGQLHFECGEYQKALDLFTRAHQGQIICTPHAAEQIGRTCKHIGDTHFALKDYPNALRDYKSALQALNRLRSRSGHRSLIASIHLSIGRVQRLMYHLEDAERTLDSVLNGNDALHLSDCYEELAQVGVTRGEYRNALNHSQRALNLREEHLPQHHPDISKSYIDLAKIQKSLPEEQQNALTNYNRAQESLRKTFPLNHSTIQHVEAQIRSISSHN